MQDQIKDKVFYVRCAIFFACLLLATISIGKLFDSLLGRLLYILIIFLAYYVSVSNLWHRFIGRAILLFLASYSCLNFATIVGFGFPIEHAFADVLSVVLATTPNEISTFFTNLTTEKPIRLITSLLCLISLLVLFSFCESRRESYVTNIKVNTISLLSLVCIFAFTLCNPTVGGSFSLLISKLPAYLSQVKMSIVAAEEKKLFRWDATSEVHGKQTIIIVLGETTRADHMQIAGYSRETTPLLARENLIVFKDSISIGYHTLLSTPYMLTRKPVTANNIHILFGESSIISAFKEAGFKTYYLSYLRPIVKGDNAINQIVREADIYIQRSSDKNKRGGVEDTLYLPIVKDILQSDDFEKKLIVIKLIGSHFNYQDRYPIEFDKFQPSFKTTPYTGPDLTKKDIFVNTYDNSILHTDYVVASMINYLKQEDDEDVLLAFISDHGTSIYEDNQTLYGGMKKANYNAAMFFWLGEKASKRLSYGLPNMKANQEMPVDSTYFIDTVMTLAGIATDKKVGKNLFNDKLLPEDRRLVIFGTNVVPYNQIN